MDMYSVRLCSIYGVLIGSS